MTKELDNIDNIEHIDPAIEAAERAMASLRPAITLVPDGWDVVADVSVAAAREAFGSVQGVLEWLGRNTQPPCGLEETAARRTDALEAIAKLVYPADHADPSVHRPQVTHVHEREDLEALPDGSVYVSDSYPDIPETKARGVWWTPERGPFEPALPGTVVYVPANNPTEEP